MHNLLDLLGDEHDLGRVGRELRAAVRDQGAPVVGALHVTCSDESEQECQEVFLRSFAQEMLPRLRYGDRAPFRLANPGARYEPGAVRIAEDHFSTAEARRGFKVMVVKLNGHVALEPDPETGVRFGSLRRYDQGSAACGGVRALLDGSKLPFAREMAEGLRAGGRDRLATLLEMDDARDGRAMLYGALSSAYAQARRCVRDAEQHEPASPTLYLVLHGVTLNRPGHDTELVAGLHVLDHRGARHTTTYRGLGDDPADYVLETCAGRIRVADRG